MIVNRILFVYLKIRLRWLIRFGGGGSLELDVFIKIVQLYKISDISMFDSQIYFCVAGGRIKLEREDIVCQRILFADEYCFPSCRHSHISPFCPHENISDSCPAHILHSVHTEVLPPTFFPSRHFQLCAVFLKEAGCTSLFLFRMHPSQTGSPMQKSASCTFWTNCVYLLINVLAVKVFSESFCIYTKPNRSIPNAEGCSVYLVNKLRLLRVTNYPLPCIEMKFLGFLIFSVLLQVFLFSNRSLVSFLSRPQFSPLLHFGNMSSSSW